MLKRKLIAALGAAVLAIAMLPASAFAYWTGGYEVIIDGVSVANVKNSAKVTAMVAVVNDQVCTAYGAQAAIEPEIELKAKILSSEKLTDDKQLHDAIAAVSDYMTKAVRITVNGNETICVGSEDEVKSTRENIIAALGVEGADSEIYEPIDMEEEVVPYANIYTAREAADYLIKHGIVSVRSVAQTSSNSKYIPEPEKISNPELYEGVSETFESGRAGEQTVTKTSYYINGELSDTVTENKVIDEGVPAKVYVGTKERPVGVGTGKFIRPASGKLTSSYGARWGRNHNGIDIGAPVGTPIYASDDGVVSCSEYKNSFGNLIKIDHQNGYETYYAHNSALLVEVGQTVKKGQLIAKMGSTGNSTGSHCHFEIRYNGEIKNPANYI